jgi:hypothetical protein
MAVMMSALHTGNPLPPGKFFFLISVRVYIDPRDILWLEGLDQIGNRLTPRIETRDILACSIVPQPSTKACRQCKDL